MKTTISIVLMGLLLLFFSCSSENEAMEEETMAPEEVIDPDLVGNWPGEASGTLGDVTVILRLESNGNADLEIVEGSDEYCPIPDLRWYVLGTKFKMEGTDECHSSFVEFDAPYSKQRLTGFWKSSLNNGTFSVTKQ